MKLVAFSFLIVPSEAIVAFRSGHSQNACITQSQSMKAGAESLLQGICLDMCKEIGAHNHPLNWDCDQRCAGAGGGGGGAGPAACENVDHTSSESVMACMQSVADNDPYGLVQTDNNNANRACAAQDSKFRAEVDSKTKGVCLDMCKELGKSDCSQCDDGGGSGPTGPQNWKQTLSHMDNLASWGKDLIKDWHTNAAKL